MPVKKEENLNSNTKQRQVILGLLKGSKIHLTADLIYNKLKRRFKNLTLGKVYKDLHILKEKGQVRELDLGAGIIRFEIASQAHYHFICNSCQKIFEIRIPVMKELDEKISQISGFRVFSHRLEFLGLCDICKTKRPN